VFASAFADDEDIQRGDPLRTSAYQEGSDLNEGRGAADSPMPLEGRGVGWGWGVSCGPCASDLSGLGGLVSVEGFLP
jgi:hypothetical protein